MTGTAKFRMVGGPHHGALAEQPLQDPARVWMVPQPGPAPAPAMMCPYGMGADPVPLRHYEYALTRTHESSTIGLTYVYVFQGKDRLIWCDPWDLDRAKSLLQRFTGIQQVSAECPLSRLHHCWLLPSGVIPSATVLAGYRVLRSPHYPQVMFADMGDIHSREGFIPAYRISRKGQNDDRGSG